MIIITNKEEQIICIPKSRQTVVTQSGVYTKNQVDALLDLKQDTLKSGTTIKTINGESILGSGNIKINADLSDYYTKEQVDEKIDEINIPEKTSELTNDSGFITISDVEPLIPTKVSAFQNDAGYLTEHQSLIGYATEQWVNNQGFAKTSQIPTDYAKPSDITTAINNQTFKTINGESIKGSGNIEIKGDDVDTAMSDTSSNAVENKVIKLYVDGMVGDIAELLSRL